MHCVSRGGCYLVNSFCDIQEENHWKRESYQAYWLALVIETRPQYKLTLSETDSIRRESYKQQQVAHFMVERNPSQTLRLGTHNRFMIEHHLPLFNTTKNDAPSDLMPSQQNPVKLEWLTNGEGDQRAPGVTQDLNKPVRMNFRASSLMSSPREISHRVQNRE